MKYGRFATLALSLALSINIAAAESPSFLDTFLDRNFPENTDVRKQYWTSLITVPKEGAWSFKERIVQSKSGLPVKIGATRRDSDFVIQFQNGADGAFSAWSRGSFSIVRDSQTGYFLQAKIFLQDDPTCYIRLYPQAEATRMDVVMYGAVLKKGMYVPGLIYYVLDDSVASLVRQTRSLFDWSKVFGDGNPPAQAAFAKELREGSFPADADVDKGTAPPPTALAAAPQVLSHASDAPATLPPASAPAPSTGSMPRAQSLASMVAKAASVETLASALAARGETCAEFLPPAADAAAPALGFADDSDPLATKTPYKSLARYEAGKGLPLAQIRAALYLDSLASPGSVYALLGEGLRVLAIPSYGPDGRFTISLFSDSRELSWADLPKPKDAKLRVLRMAAGR